MFANHVKGSHIYTFNSIADFKEYIDNTPTNKVFEGSNLSSKRQGYSTYSFTKTYSFEEAEGLLKHGWNEKAKLLEQRLQAVKNQIEPSQKDRAFYDVQGFQCSVPRYLQGIPTSMIAKKKVMEKQKVITLNKSVSYSANVNSNEIVEESVKALQIVKKLEAQGYSVNLNVIMGSANYPTKLFAKIRIKSANERLNVAKTAFPLVHPSMLRRMLFRFIEVCPDTTNPYKYGYGLPADNDELRIACKDEYILPAFIRDETKIKKVEDIAKFKA